MLQLAMIPLRASSAFTSSTTRTLQHVDDIVDRARHNRQLLKAVGGDEHIVLDAHAAKAAEATQHGSVDEARLRRVGQRRVEQLQNEIRWGSCRCVGEAGERKIVETRETWPERETDK
jgi:hypothetical protein